MKTARTLFGLVILTILVLFIFMNTGSVRVDLMFVAIEAPVSLIVLMASAAGVLLWPLLKPLLPKKKS